MSYLKTVCLSWGGVLKSLESTVCECVRVCVCCPRLCVLVYVGRRNIGLLAASFPQVLSNGDKGVACGKIDRGMLCLFRRGCIAARGKESEEKAGEFTRGERWSRQQKGSDRKRKRRGGDFWRERDAPGKSWDGSCNGRRQRDSRSVKRLPGFLRDPRMRVQSPASNSCQIPGPLESNYSRVALICVSQTQFTHSVFCFLFFFLLLMNAQLHPAGAAHMHSRGCT